LGFQLALFGKKSLNYSITCLVRRFSIETDYLNSQGIRILYGDMLDSKILLESMFGSNVVIDATTGRNYEKIEDSDVAAKLMLLRFCEELKIDHFVFFSLVSAEKFKGIPLVKAKLFLEERIKQSDVNYTIFRLTGFYQGIIKEYVIPIIDKEFVYLIEESIPISYIDCIDVARLVLRSFTSSIFLNKTIDIGGLDTWDPKKILDLCEKYSGLEPNVKKFPASNILLTRLFTRLFEGAWPVSRRLDLIEIVLQGKNFLVTDSEKLLQTFSIDQDELRPLPSYLLLYINTILDMIIAKYNGTLEDDEKELEEWERMGIKVVEDLNYLNEEFRDKH